MNQDNNSADIRRENRTLLVALAVITGATALLAIIGFFFLKAPAEIIEGQAEATSVRISGKLPGRIAELYVREGDMVRKGDTLVHIHSSLAEAKMMQAEGMQSAADAANDKVDAGTRPQIINAAYEMWQQAKAAVTISRKTFDRMQNLFEQGVVAEQKRDEAKAAYEAAAAAEKAAKSQYELARDGAQHQDRAASSAMVQVARGGVDEVKALLDDSYLTAPCDGQIDVIYPEEGELVSIGTPIMSLLKIADKYITFNVREELLNDLTIGKEITLMIPALGQREIKAEIYYVRDMGTYAVWRATKSVGQWDSRTFEIKARPLDRIPELRPGMTVVYRK